MKINPLQISDFLKNFSTLLQITVVTYYVAIFFGDWNAFWCKITCLAAILNAMIDYRLSDYQVTISLVLMDSLIPKTMV